MAGIHESGENYLETILILKNKGLDIRSIDIVHEMSLSKPSVSRAVGILKNGGFIEIVAPLNDDSAVGKAVASRGEGLHTMALEVDDLDATIKDLESNGVQLIGVGSPQVFIHPKSANGILVQLAPAK